MLHASKCKADEDMQNCDLFHIDRTDGAFLFDQFDDVCLKQLGTKKIELEKALKGKRDKSVNATAVATGLEGGNERLKDTIVQALEFRALLRDKIAMCRESYSEGCMKIVKRGERDVWFYDNNLNRLEKQMKGSMRKFYRRCKAYIFNASNVAPICEKAADFVRIFLGPTVRKRRKRKKWYVHVEKKIEADLEKHKDRYHGETDKYGNFIHHEIKPR